MRSLLKTAYLRKNVHLFDAEQFQEETQALRFPGFTRGSKQRKRYSSKPQVSSTNPPRFRLGQRCFGTAE
jgi:hypothetical protein